MSKHISTRTPIAILVAGMLAAPVVQALPIWTPAGVSFDWSSGTNWSGGIPPGLADTPTFGVAGSGGFSTVNQNFTIAGLTYSANSTHGTNVSAGNQLQILGPIWVGVGAPSDGATATWRAGGIVTVGDATAARSLWIGANNSVAGSGTSIGSLTLEDISVVGFVNDLSIGRKSGPSFVASGANGTLVLGSNSTLSVGTAAARANVFVGYNDTNAGAATGLLDARQGTLDIHALNFSVGAGYGGSGNGTLRWDRPTMLDVTNMYIGRGIGSGTLDLAPGATFLLGSAASRSSLLGIAYNDSAAGAGTAQAAIDLSVNNPSFAAYLASDLSIGRKSGPSFVASGANGTLVLGSNSTLSVGTAAARANVFVGYNDTNAGAATGLLDARQGTLDIHALNFSVGVGLSGSATGTVYSGAAATIDATDLRVGTGPAGNGAFHLTAGTVTARTTTLGSSGRFIFTGGRFNAIEFIGALSQDGGVLAPGSGFGASKLQVTQGYSLASLGVLEIDIAGSAAGSGYDQVVTIGAVNLNRDGGAGGTLDLNLGFGAPLGSTYTIIANDGTDVVLGTFAGLPEGSPFVANFGSVPYAFTITYVGDTGNDVVLTAVAVPEPQTWLLLVLGLAGMLSWRRAHADEG